MARRISADRTAALLGSAAARSPAYLGIADAVRLLVSDGRIPPGTALPSERELTAALGVSRTTVTRAYQQLRDLGYLTSRRGSGSVARLPRPRGAGTDRVLRPGGDEAGVIDLTCAAPVAPAGVVTAFEHAVAELPAYLTGTGYFPSGLPELRAAIARRYTERGLDTEPDQVVVTSGGLSAVAVAVRALVSAGDRVLVESPTYPNAIATLRRAGARVLGADVTAEGWATPALVETVRQVRPAAAYLIPDYHNPTGALMSAAERAVLAAELRRTRTAVIVDETMCELGLDKYRPHGPDRPDGPDDPDGPDASDMVSAPPPFAAAAPGAVSVGSASKAFWGGLRIGWLRAPADLIGDLVSARLTLDLGAPLVEQLALVHLLREREAVLSVRRSRLLASRDALAAALSDRLPQWRFAPPPGGLSLWCELPAPLSSALTTAAEELGLLLAPGPAFAPEGGLEQFLRVPYTAAPEVLEQAVDRLAEAWDVASTRTQATPRQRPIVA